MERCRKRLLEESTCSVCLEYFTDPVTLDCGHNFCRSCITKCWEESNRDAACALCREMVEAKRLKPNKQIANMVEIAKEMSHILKHSVVSSVDEDVQDCKEVINLYLEVLRKERGKMLPYKAQSKKQSQVLLKQMEAGRAKNRVAFKKLHQFLEDQEKLILVKAEEVEKEIRRRDGHLSGKLSSLESFITDLEELQQLSGDDYLENFGKVLRRFPKESLKYPLAFPVDLMLKVQDFCDDNPYMEVVKKLFQDSLISGFLINKERVTLDPVTAHPQLILSEDLKSVRWSHQRQDLPNNPQRFDCMPFVLGKERFSSGTHFWDVAVGCEEKWAVGVARTYVRRKGEMDHNPKREYWYLGKWKSKYRVYDNRTSSSLSFTQLKKIRVTLDCAGGRVAFFNADTGELLYVYADPSLRGETLVPFFYVEAGGHLTLCP